VLLLAAPGWGASELCGRRFRLWGLGAALVAAAVTLAGKTVEVWPDNPGFPSVPTAWAVTIAVFVVGRDRRWLPWVVPLLALLAVALVLANYPRSEVIEPEQSRCSSPPPPLFIIVSPGRCRLPASGGP